MEETKSASSPFKEIYLYLTNYNALKIAINDRVIFEEQFIEQSVKLTEYKSQLESITKRIESISFKGE